MHSQIFWNENRGLKINTTTTTYPHQQTLCASRDMRALFPNPAGCVETFPPPLILIRSCYFAVILKYRSPKVKIDGNKSGGEGRLQALSLTRINHNKEGERERLEDRKKNLILKTK